MGEFIMSQSVVTEDKDVVCWQRKIGNKTRACCIGHFVTALRKNPRQEFLVQDYESLPEYVLVDDVKFKKGDRVVLFEKPHRFVCAEYYRVDYEGRIKNDDGRWEKDGIIRPAYPVLLKRGIDFHRTRM